MNNIVAATESYAVYLHSILDGATLYHTYNLGCTRSSIGSAVCIQLITLSANIAYPPHA